MQVQDTSFLSLLIIIAALPIAAKFLAELYIKIATFINRRKDKNRDHRDHVDKSALPYF